MFFFLLNGASESTDSQRVGFGWFREESQADYCNESRREKQGKLLESTAGGTEIMADWERTTDYGLRFLYTIYAEQDSSLI